MKRDDGPAVDRQNEDPAYFNALSVAEAMEAGCRSRKLPIGRNSFSRVWQCLRPGIFQPIFPSGNLKPSEFELRKNMFLIPH
jgi:hypothetical protein